MPILYVHGVNTRSRAGFLAIEPVLRRLVAPAISSDPAGVFISDVYWGDHGVKLRWDGASRPRTRLLGKGVVDANIGLVERSLAADAYGVALEDVAERSAPDSGQLSAPGTSSARESSAPASLARMPKRELSDLLATLAVQSLAGPADRQTPDAATAVDIANMLLAVDAVVEDPQTQAAIAGKSTEQQIDVLLTRVHQLFERDSALAGKGASKWLPALKDRVTKRSGVEPVCQATPRRSLLPNSGLASMRWSACSSATCSFTSTSGSNRQVRQEPFHYWCCKA